MRPDLERPVPADTPLVSGVTRPEGATPGADEERDEEIIRTLRRKLKDRGLGIAKDTPAGLPRGNGGKGPAAAEDKYEPQRLGRKICWQYDQSAKKVPLLRRHYI